MRAFPFFVSLLLAGTALYAQNAEKPGPRPHVVVVGVNGMELDVIRPLLLKGAMPNLEHVINNALTENCARCRHRIVRGFTARFLPVRMSMA